MLKENEYYAYNSNLYSIDDDREFNIIIIAKNKKQAQELCFKVLGLKIFDRVKNYKYIDNVELSANKLMEKQFYIINKEINNGKIHLISKEVK